ncbi:MAG: winged helix-turn-helix domain-containing protein [Candidatus Bathyarchaeia archaeon]|jgi:predicted transcriptional regulator
MNPMFSLDEKTKRRDKLSIIAEILDIAKDGALKTQIMYRANLSFAQLGEYLTFMSNTDLLEKIEESGREVYGATEKGINFLERHGELVELINGCKTGKNGVKIPKKLLMRRN